MNGDLPLRIDTSLRSALELSSNSSLSATTIGSDACFSSELDDGTQDDEEDAGIVPKVENNDMASLKYIKEMSRSRSPDDEGTSVIAGLTDTRKRRGRPRKNPSAALNSDNQVGKGRSKTGCITCRRRKKKCDEARPSCLNCRKNAVICEGYRLKEFWKGGRQRAEPNDSYAGTVRKISFAIPRSLPVLVDGIETEVDRRFLDHFVYDLSGVLTLHDNNSNPFKDLLLPMATQHKGLMHSLMALSGSHIIAREPEPAFNERQLYHFDAAVTTLNADIKLAINSDRDTHGLLVEDPTVASTIVHCLICICKGSTNGEYRMHMNGARQLINSRQSSNPEFREFITEFFQYHDVCNSLTTLDRRPLVVDDNDDRSLPNFVINPAIQPGAGAMIGVLDGLFKFITDITALRDNIRSRKDAGQKPLVPYESLARAVNIDVGIHAWDPAQEPNTPRWIAAQLYRQCTWVYLYRTIQPSKPSPKITAAVDDGLEYLRIMPPGESTQAILLLPVFILSCAAFQENQRPDLEKAFDNLQAYSNLGNIRIARQVVRRVWEMMDSGDERSWDWEGIMTDMGIDLLVT